MLRLDRVGQQQEHKHQFRHHRARELNRGIAHQPAAFRLGRDDEKDRQHRKHEAQERLEMRTEV